VQDGAVLVLIALLGYLFGSFPTAYLLVRRVTGKNILELGTANVGTLNVLRATNSKVMTAVNLLGDVAKGVLALVVGYLLADATGGDGHVGAATGGIASVVGHNYTVFLKFQGGKGIATSLPVLFFLEPLLVPVWIATFFLTVGATRLLVLGQIMGTVVAPIVAVLFFRDDAVAVVILGAIVFIRHAPRIKVILEGKEPKLYYKIDNAPDAPAE
jgi:glycerol-3-phosphate acyltransferase PlsY